MFPSFNLMSKIEKKSLFTKFESKVDLINISITFTSTLILEAGPNVEGEVFPNCTMEKVISVFQDGRHHQSHCI